MSVPRYPEQEKAPVAETTDGVLASSFTRHDREPIPDLRAEAMIVSGGREAMVEADSGYVYVPGNDDDQAVVTAAELPKGLVSANESADPWVAEANAYADEPVDAVPSAQDAINEMVENGWQPEALMRHLRHLGPILEQWASEPGFPRHSGLFMLSAATAIENLIRSEADLEAKLEAECTLRAQASAELEREKARERERRIDADGRSRDLLWALDAAIEALTPLAGYASEEDGRVAGMTAPVCLAMSSVRRADALVKLHRALRR